MLNKTATVGDTVHLECEVDGTPEPRITWSKDSQRLANDSNVVIVKSSFKSLLTIAKVHKIDAGRYSCRASNGLGLPVEEHGLLVVEDRSEYDMVPYFYFKQHRQYQIKPCGIYYVIYYILHLYIV